MSPYAQSTAKQATIHDGITRNDSKYPSAFSARKTATARRGALTGAEAISARLLLFLTNGWSRVAFPFSRAAAIVIFISTLRAFAWPSVYNNAEKSKRYNRREVMNDALRCGFVGWIIKLNIKILSNYKV